MNEVVVMCVAVRALLAFDTLNIKMAWRARRMGDVKSELSRIFDVKYLTFLTSKDDFLVAAKTGRLHVQQVLHNDPRRDEGLQRAG